MAVALARPQGCATHVVFRTVQHLKTPHPWWRSIHHLLGGIPTPLKNRKVNWDDYSQYMGKFKMFQTINQPPMLRWQLPLHNKQLEAGGQSWLHAAAGRWRPAQPWSQRCEQQNFVALGKAMWESAILLGALEQFLFVHILGIIIPTAIHMLECT